MSSVRDRLPQLPEKDPQADPAKARTNLTGGNFPTPSVRENSGIDQTPEKKLVPNKNALRFAGLTDSVPTVGTVRQRLDAQRDAAAEVTAPTPQSAVADEYYAIYQREQAQKKADEAEAERRNQALILKHQREDEEERRRTSPEERLKRKLFDLMWESISATPAEIAQITQLIRQHKTDQIGNPDSYRMLLLEQRALREELQRAPKPEWAGR